MQKNTTLKAVEKGFNQSIPSRAVVTALLRYEVCVAPYTYHESSSVQP